MQPSGAAPSTWAHCSSRSQRRVGADVERLIGAAEALADDEGAAVGGDHGAVRELQATGGDLDGAVGSDQREIGFTEVGAGVEVEPEVADVGVAGGVDDHVVAQAAGDAGQVGVLDERPAVVAEELLVLHRHDEEPSVGQPAQTGRLVVQTGVHRASFAVRGHGVDGVLEEVAVPQRAVVPTRPFAEVDATNQLLEISSSPHRDSDRVRAAQAGVMMSAHRTGAAAARHRARPNRQP